MNPLLFDARPRPTQEAWAVAYVRHLMDRTGENAEQIANHYYCEAGANPERDWGRFVRWCRAALMAVDRGGVPFAERSCVR